MLFVLGVLVLLIPLLAVVLDSQLGRALARRVERGGRRLDEAVVERIAALEAEVERLNGEVHRLREANEFLHRLLEGKSPAKSALTSGGEKG